MNRRIKYNGWATSIEYAGTETPRVGEYIYHKPHEETLEIQGDVIGVARVIDYLGGGKEVVVITIEKPKKNGTKKRNRKRISETGI